MVGEPHLSGYVFYICRGKARNGELRSGFNISTSKDSDKLCLYEFGRARGQSDDYDCLCSEEPLKG